MFEELLGEANETLLSSIYSYDKSKHNNFKQYLTYNLDVLIINKQTKIINDGTYKPNFVYVDKYENNIFASNKDEVTIKILLLCSLNNLFIYNEKNSSFNPTNPTFSASLIVIKSSSKFISSPLLTIVFTHQLIKIKV